MTVRPLDYGDQYPSDLNDTAPLKPTDAFSELDYLLGLANRVNPLGIKFREPRKDTPDQGQIPSIVPVRQSFAGVVIERKEDNTYSVVRQDGKLFNAVCYGDDDLNSVLWPGDSVTVNSGQVPDTWFLEGAHRPTELTTISATNGSDIGPTDTTKAIEFDTLLMQTDTDLVLTEGGIRIDRKDISLYRVSWSVTVDLQNPDQFGDLGATISVNEGCFNTIDSVERDTPTQKLLFNRNSGFKVGRDSDNCATQVMLNVPESHYVPQTQAGGGDVIWTNVPIISGSIIVGTHATQGWVKIQDAGNTHVWLGHGKRSVKILFPDNEPQISSHLTVIGVKGEAIQTAWTPSGVDGTITIKECVSCPYSTQTTKKYKVDRGIIIEGPNLSVNEQNEAPTVNDVERKIWAC